MLVPQSCARCAKFPPIGAQFCPRCGLGLANPPIDNAEWTPPRPPTAPHSPRPWTIATVAFIAVLVATMIYAIESRTRHSKPTLDTVLPAEDGPISDDKIADDRTDSRVELPLLPALPAIPPQREQPGLLTPPDTQPVVPGPPFVAEPRQPAFPGSPSERWRPVAPSELMPLETPIEMGRPSDPKKSTTRPTIPATQPAPGPISAPTSAPTTRASAVTPSVPTPLLSVPFEPPTPARKPSTVQAFDPPAPASYRDPNEPNPSPTREGSANGPRSLTEGPTLPAPRDATAEGNKQSTDTARSEPASASTTRQTGNALPTNSRYVAPPKPTAPPKPEAPRRPG